MLLLLQGRVAGQAEAVSAAARALQRAGAGLRDGRRPVATMLFCGPTGVGKTLLAKVLPCAALVLVFHHLRAKYGGSMQVNQAECQAAASGTDGNSTFHRLQAGNHHCDAARHNSLMYVPGLLGRCWRSSSAAQLKPSRASTAASSCSATPAASSLGRRLVS